jgi:nitrate/nitrite-specific signal transduction histidine kinase
MDAQGSYKPYTSIRFRLLLLLGIITALAVLVTTIIAVTSTQIQGRSAQDVSGRALRQQAEVYLLQLTQVSAAEYNLAMQQIIRETDRLAAYAAAIFNNPQAFNPQAYWAFDDHLTQEAEGQYKNTAEDVSSLFVPNFVEMTDELKQEIELSAYLDLVFPDIFEKNRIIDAIYFATPNQMVRYYPNIDLGSTLNADFQVTQRVWFNGSLPEANPERATWWTPVYVDPAGTEAVTTAAAPVYNQAGELVGVVGMDISLDEMKADIEATQVLETGYSFLVDKDGKAVALTEMGFLDVMGYLPGENFAGTDLTTTLTGFSPIIEKMMAGESGFGNVVVAGKELIVAYAPLESTGWSQGSVVAAGDVLRAVTLLENEVQTTTRSLVMQRILPVSVIILFAVLLVGWLIANRLSRPIQQLASAAVEIQSGNWEIEVPSGGKDEIGVLAVAFKEMAERMHEAFAQLEQRVAERTRDLERRTNQIQAAAEVARDAAASQELNTLLQRAVSLVRDRFGFYHAGIFLLDEAREYAVLRAATGEAGQRMLERGHRLKVGEEGIVGFVSATNQPRISLDVGEDAVHFKNPILPETRSEMGLPLRAGDRVIGVLDVQSKQAAAFDQDDITILQTLADQLAVAIENARLLQEAQENLQQLQVLYGRYNLEAWESLENARNVIGYLVDHAGLHPVTNPQNGGSVKTIAEPEPPISQPLEVRGQPIGYLDIWPGQTEGANLETEFIQAISERISLALESARIFEETRTLAFHEETLNQMVARFNQSLDFNTLLDSALTQLWQMPNVSEVSIHIGPPEAFSAEEPGAPSDDQEQAGA